MQAQNDSILVKSGYTLTIKTDVYKVYIDKGGYFILMRDKQTRVIYKQYLRIRDEQNS